VKKSNINFNYFVGQKILEINTEENLPLGIRFDNGGLIVECPWRLRKIKTIIIGGSDCISSPDNYSHKKVETLLMGKKVESITFFEDFSMLVIEFEGNYSLDLFHDSNYFEGWQLYGDNGFDLISLPGGF